MVGESFHPSGCWGEDSNHIRLGATVQKLLRLFAFSPRRGVSVFRFVSGAIYLLGGVPVSQALSGMAARRETEEHGKENQVLQLMMSNLTDQSFPFHNRDDRLRHIVEWQETGIN